MYHVFTVEQSQKHGCNGAYDHYNYIETRLNMYVIRQKFNNFTDVIGSVFVVTIQRIICEIAFISANFDVGVSCSPIFVFEGIV